MCFLQEGREQGGRPLCDRLGIAGCIAQGDVRHRLVADREGVLVLGLLSKDAPDDGE